jgi:uncharacterized tellurite resistance protein B-like protein
LLKAGGIDSSDIEFLYDFENMSWESIPTELLDKEYSCLNSLSEEGLLYVMPAYLKMALFNHDDSFDWETRLLNAITSVVGKSLNLSDEQRLAIIKILLEPLTSKHECSRSKQDDELVARCWRLVGTSSL